MKKPEADGNEPVEATEVLNIKLSEAQAAGATPAGQQIAGVDNWKKR